MNTKNLDTILFRILLSFSTFVLIYVALFSKVHYEGSESIFHYLHSEAIFNHPEILVNHWGKPIFIALASPFTFFGEKGVMVFNCIVMLISALYSFKIGQKLGFKFSFPIVVLVIFSPVYYKFSQSCLTEPLFGLLAVLSAYLFLIKRYNWSSFLISFILFSRSEGMLFIPIYVVALICKKQFKSLPFLLIGFVFYGIIGWLVGKGFLWYYYDYPYHGSAVDIYGKGPFWNYFINQEHITGTPFSIFILFSSVIFGTMVLLNFKKIFKHENIVFIGLIVLPALIYVFGHSYLWYAGKSASVGLYRIVGGVVPLLALLVLYGFDKLINFLTIINLHKLIQASILLVCCIWMIYFNFRNSSSLILVQESPIEKLINQSIQYIKKSDLQDRTMYVFQAHYLPEFNGDHFNRVNSKVKQNIDNKTHPENELKSGDILVWDGKMSPNEGGIPIETLINNKEFELLTTFRPNNEFKVLGGGYYYIAIFERK